MKKYIVILCGIFLLSVNQGAAEYAEGMDEQAFQAKQERRVQKRMGRMTKKLNLSDEQQKAVRRIIEEKWQKKWEIKKDKFKKMQDLRQETHGKLKAVLNPDQQGKFEKMCAEKKEKRCHKKKRGKKKKGKNCPY